MRDNFTKRVKESLARRVGFRCSNPNCRLLTIGPAPALERSINLGVAAHICAAAAGGPRFDPKMTPLARMSAANGIWLCQIHAALIDRAVSRFPAKLLRKWKALAEEAARLEVEEIDKAAGELIRSDIQALKVYAEAFDRPAFNTPFDREVVMSAFDQAIRDTLTALNVGVLYDRNGRVLKTTVGRSQLRNRSWSNRIGVVAELVSAIGAKYQAALLAGDIKVYRGGAPSPYGVETYDLRNSATSDWMDETRDQAAGILNEVLREAGLDPIDRETLRHRRWRLG